MNTSELLDQVYIEKMAQYELEKEQALSTLEKVGDVAGADLSALSEQEKIELWNILMTQYQNPEVQAQLNAQENQQAPVADATQTSVDTSQAAPQADFAQYVMSDPNRANEFQMKVAEIQTTSTMWASNASDIFTERAVDFIPKMAEVVAELVLQKIAEALEGAEKAEEKDDKKDSFEALSQMRAAKMKEDMEKKAAFDALVEKRALEILQSNK